MLAERGLLDLGVTEIDSPPMHLPIRDTGGPSTHPNFAEPGINDSSRLFILVYTARRRPPRRPQFWKGNLVEEFFAHPAVQGGIAPFVVGLVVALLLQSARLGGLALVAAFATAVYFVAGFTFMPLTATRKIILLGFAAPVIGMLIDFGFKANRTGAAMLALAAGAAALWIFWPVLSQKGVLPIWQYGGAAAVAVAFMVGFGQLFLANNGVRAGAAGLGTGLGVGVAAILAASATYGLYGIALGAGSGAFLLVQMIRGRVGVAGATFTLPAMLIAGLVAAAAMFLAQLPWHALLVLALIPVGACMPLPSRARVWQQAVLLSLCTFTIAGVACYLAWHSSGGTPG